MPPVDGDLSRSDLLRRLANASWPLFRAFGVEVRLHWSTVFVPLLTFSSLVRATDLTNGEAAVWALGLTLLTYLVIYTHEMGHVWAGRSVGVRSSQITLWPLGGLAHLDRPAPTPRAEIWIALAGPLTHAIWFFVVGAPYFLLARGDQGGAAQWGLAGDVVRWFLQVNAGLLFFNLLPFWPMDGGRVMRGLIARHRHPSYASLLTAYVGFAGAGILVLAGLAAMFQFDGEAASFFGSLTFCIGLMNFFACRQLLLEARWSEGPYEDASEPWKQSLPQSSWSLEDPTPAEPVVVEERRVEKPRRGGAEATQRRREAARPVARPLQERIDELLDRINEVGGIENLSEAERRELADASEKLKRERPAG